MRGKGITYDTGFLTAGGSTHEPFDPELVQREMRLIRDDLQCNAVRVTGGNVDRLEIAATHGATAGLEVWWSPFTNDLEIDELLAVLADCAGRAERLRQAGAEVVLLTGSELSLFTQGFLPGAHLRERLALLTAPQPEYLRDQLAQVPPRINDFLRKAVAIVRRRFSGKISYASLPFERVDWTPFDYISTDAGYRSIAVADRFREGIRALVAQGKPKPVAITEFGCTTHRGAANLGGRGDTIVAWDDDGKPMRLKGGYVRDEGEQATYLRELLDIFAGEGVDTAFVNTFARYDLPHRSDPREDLDLASYGVVKVFADRRGDAYPDMPWEPKAAFTTLADYYHPSARDQSRG
jgi:hypothetical protein